MDTAWCAVKFSKYIYANRFNRGVFWESLQMYNIPSPLDTALGAVTTTADGVKTYTVIAGQ